MKKVTAFVGSARKKGYTSIATKKFLNYLEAYGDVQSEMIFLCDHNLGLCRGCKTCFSRGEEHCPLKGDRDLLLGKMLTSDGVVFASPNYSFQVSAHMKAFLDRLGFVFHRPRFFGKTCTSIVAQGIYGGEKLVKYLDFAGNALGFNLVKGSYVMSMEPMTEKGWEKMEDTIAKHSQKFHAQLLKPAYPTPSVFGLMIFRLGRTSMKKMLGEDSRDHTYYRDQGWFESDFYYPTNLGPMKKGVGAIFDWYATRAFKPRIGVPDPSEPSNGNASAS